MEEGLRGFLLCRIAPENASKDGVVFEFVKAIKVKTPSGKMPILQTLLMHTSKGICHQLSCSLIKLMATS